MERRREEVAWNYNPRTHLFQKTYYQNLTVDEEKSLRTSFNDCNASHEMRDKIAKAGMFLGFWPSVWYVSKVTRPASVFLFAGAYFAAWQYGVQPMNLQMLQSSLNSAALPVAKNYNLA